MEVKSELLEDSLVSKEGTVPFVLIVAIGPQVLPRNYKLVSFNSQVNETKIVLYRFLSDFTVKLQNTEAEFFRTKFVFFSTKTISGKSTTLLV